MPFRAGSYTGIDYFYRQVTDSNGNVIMGTPNQDVGVWGIDNFINQKVRNNQQDSIVAVFMIPHVYCDPLLTTSPHVENYYVTRPTTLDGHVVRNKKLLTYPYNFLCLDSLNASHNYKFEYGDTLAHVIHVRTIGAMNPNFQISIAPVAYNGSGNNPNFTESFICDTFEQCPFIIDAYRAWLAQRASGQIIQGLGSLATGGLSVLTGRPISGALSLMGLASTINQMVVDSTQGAKARGGSGAGIYVASKSAGIYAKKMCVNNSYAEAIDSYFDRYGYATQRIKVPNRNVRPYWTYTQTRDCSIHGNLPAEAMTKISEIYNKGITFWNRNADIGNYTQNNAV